MHSLIKKYNCKSILIVIIFTIALANAYSQNIVSGGGTSAIPINPGFKETKKEDAENKPKVDEVSFNLGLIRFTTTDKKLELNHYNYFHSEKFTDFFLGVAASGEIKNSVTNLFSSGDVVSGGEANLRLGLRLFKNNSFFTSYIKPNMTPEEVQEILDKKTKPASDLWLIAIGGFKGSSFKLFKPDSVFSKQIEKTNFTGTEINVELLEC
jgi:hypothetical protein